MSTKLDKHSKFVSELMNNKGVTAIPGISLSCGKKLRKAGFDKAYVVFGQFLWLKRKEDSFIAWLKKVAGVSNHEATLAYNSMKEWYNLFM